MAMLFAGTSGFAYPAWKPGFYPEKLAQAKFLEHYATRLNCVEVNYTFRRMPSATTLENWVSTTPGGFVFAVKAHQRITHIQRLKGSEQSTEIFLKAIDPLRSARRLGPILFQLPPNLKCDVERLTSYLALLPPDLRYAFEFRNTTWLCDEVYAALREKNVSLCLAESEKLEIPEVITADFVYYRLRKPEYTAEDLQAIRRRTQELLATDRDLYLMFKHEENPSGALNAEALLRGAAAGESE
jgi:uncharacterized protein YecE (DUF72 family)